MITDQQFKDTAAIIGCAVSAIKAVYQVEAAGHGYLADGRVKILFEGHRFWKSLVKTGMQPDKFIKSNYAYANILYQAWTKKHYIGGAKEWERVSRAIEICNKLNASVLLALNSASYGSFQILGENAALCGYGNSQEMLAAYNNGGEAEQLNSFIRFVKSKKLDDELRDKNWAAFAKGYNGSRYRENKYDVKLAAADKKFSV